MVQREHHTTKVSLWYWNDFCVCVCEAHQAALFCPALVGSSRLKYPQSDIRLQRHYSGPISKSNPKPLQTESSQRWLAFSPALLGFSTVYSSTTDCNTVGQITSPAENNGTDTEELINMKKLQRRLQQHKLSPCSALRHRSMPLPLSADILSKTKHSGPKSTPPLSPGD